MPKAQKVIDMRLQPPIIKFGDIQAKVKLPPGCIGMMFVYKSKRAARENGVKHMLPVETTNENER